MPVELMTESHSLKVLGKKAEQLPSYNLFSVQFMAKLEVLKEDTCIWKWKIYNLDEEFEDLDLVIEKWEGYEQNLWRYTK